MICRTFYFETTNAKGLETISRDIENESMVYFKMFISLNADDIILMSESSEDVKWFFFVYFKRWKLKTSVHETKIIIFLKDRLSNNLKFNIDNRHIEKVKG